MDRQSRLRRNEDFQRARREGRSWASPWVVLVAVPNELDHSRYGFAVGKRLGKAVVRNRVKRRLRHLLREALPSLSAGELLVVRALPAAGGAPWTELRSDLERCLRGVR